LHYDRLQPSSLSIKRFSDKKLRITGTVEDVEVKNGIKTVTITSNSSMNEWYTAHSTQPYKVLDSHSPQNKIYLCWRRDTYVSNRNQNRQKLLDMTAT